MTVLLIAIAAETVGQQPGPVTKILIIGTLIFAWLFSNTFTHCTTRISPICRPDDGCPGIEFPDTPEPVYWDFVYFAFTLRNDVPDVGRDDHVTRTSAAS